MIKYRLSIGYAVVILLLCCIAGFTDGKAADFIVSGIYFIALGAIVVGLYFMSYFLRRFFEKTMDGYDLLFNCIIIVASALLGCAYAIHSSNLHC